MTKIEFNDFKTRAFIRWAGGKQRSAPRIVESLPKLEEGARYFEPFLGAASVFLAYSPNSAVLTDMNRSLINVYQMIKEHCGLVSRYLSQLSARTSPDDYYEVREEFNRSRPSGSKQAARFVYLNRASYNGVYRVNLAGEFNVPWGKKEKILLPSESYLMAVRGRLANAEIAHDGFENALKDAKSGDVVYLDPPYLPFGRTAFFRHYTRDKFEIEDHERLAVLASDLSNSGVHVIISNSDLPEIRKLYSNWSMESTLVPRNVTSKKKVVRFGELLIWSNKLN